jgi:pentalenolactone synthase
MHLLFAGHETTVVQIGWSAALLLTNPSRWQALSDNPALIPNAVEELLRASTRGGAGIAGIPRYARADFQIDGVTIRAGDLVLLDIGSANHDPAVFIDPDFVDVGRKQAAHMTFGYGARYCIGAPLARIELKTVFSQLIPRFPSMQLTVDPAKLNVRHDVLAGGLGALPVFW